MSHEPDQRYPGLVVLALLATAVACAVTLVLYRRGALRLGSRGRRVAVLATWAYTGYLLANLALMLSGIGASPLERGWLDVLVGVLAVGLAALNLAVDFESIQIAIDRGAPTTVAFGPLVTVVWLYVEILRLLSRR